MDLQEIDYLKSWIKQRLDWMDVAIRPLGANVLAIEPVDEFGLIISDAGGQTLSTITWDNQAAGEYQKSLPNKSLPSIPGVYFLQVDADGQPISRKIIRF